ncbi:MAG: S41 family peptidase [Acidobacteria bacterium]|nr:MAG: S41 family peptidase [Acidobacteriota bacterium]
MLQWPAMRKPWRTTALILFAAAVLFGGVLGDKLLAVGSGERKNLRIYTELLQAAHEHYGAEVEYRELVYSSINGMLRTLDPHTSFLTPEAYESMRERQAESFYGLGILVSMRNGQLTVISPLEGTPAWRLGLRAGDVINTIEGEPTDSMTLDEAVSKLKGPKDTQVSITILRRGLDEPLPLTITRAEIPQNTVRFAYMLEPGTGYIRLTDFSRSTAGEMNQALDKLLAQGMERLILDLRSNGGGLLDQTIEVASRFVPPRSLIVETRGRTRDSRQEFRSDSDDRMLNLPLVVLVNHGTASAAEILSGAIQDHDVGLVVGTPTWGKGLVQTVYNLSFGTGLALTTAKYYTPAGRLIQRDYTSYFDYYTHFDNQGTPSVVPEVTPLDGGEFETDLGRKVYGGGGITPDVEVDLPELPRMVQFLYARNAFFDFAVDYTSRHHVDDPAWQPPPDLLQQFFDFLQANGVASAEEIAEGLADAESRALVQRQIVADVMNAEVGPEASHRVMAAGDVQIQQALALFDRAAQLLAERRALGSDVPPDVEAPRPGVLGSVNEVKEN